MDLTSVNRRKLIISKFKPAMAEGAKTEEE